MKKYLSLLLIMVLIITGCDSKNENITDNQGGQNQPSNEANNIGSNVPSEDDIPTQPSGIVCKRATTLHTETCKDKSNRCNSAGYSSSGSKGTTTITYGSLGTSGTLTSGDAFDCDVNGDGIFDAETERFYYVTDLANNNKYAVLIYYSNTTEGVADYTDESATRYNVAAVNKYGPVTVIENLPSATQWNNVALSNNNRAIITETGTNSVSGSNLPTAFSYSGYAARLLTTQEVSSACGITVGSVNSGQLDVCEYFMENTSYSYTLDSPYGYWLETPSVESVYQAWVVTGEVRRLYDWGVYDNNKYGVRPVIEVPKERIEY